jgi:hypothetical protein
METSNGSISQYAKGFGDFYSLWSFVVLNKTRRPVNPGDLATKYSDFMGKVEILKKEKDPEKLYMLNTNEYVNAYNYVRNSTGASTDQPQRDARNSALNSELLI